MSSDIKFAFALLMLVSAALIWPIDWCTSASIVIWLLVLAHVLSCRSRRG